LIYQSERFEQLGVSAKVAKLQEISEVSFFFFKKKKKALREHYFGMGGGGGGRCENICLFYKK
jgi:hypothetical protein